MRAVRAFSFAWFLRQLEAQHQAAPGVSSPSRTGRDRAGTLFLSVLSLSLVLKVSGQVKSAAWSLSLTSSTIARRHCRSRHEPLMAKI